MTLHDLTHKHYTVARDCGIFSVCTPRLLWAGRPHVGFQPDFSGARWYPVPPVCGADGEPLLVKLLAAENAFTAMTMLRSAHAAVQEKRVRKHPQKGAADDRA